MRSEGAAGGDADGAGEASGDQMPLVRGIVLETRVGNLEVDLGKVTQVLQDQMHALQKTLSQGVGRAGAPSGSVGHTQSAASGPLEDRLAAIEEKVAALAASQRTGSLRMDHVQLLSAAAIDKSVECTARAHSACMEVSTALKSCTGDLMALERVRDEICTLVNQGRGHAGDQPSVTESLSEPIHNVDRIVSELDTLNKRMSTLLPKMQEVRTTAEAKRVTLQDASNKVQEAKDNLDKANLDAKDRHEALTKQIGDAQTVVRNLERDIQTANQVDTHLAETVTALGTAKLALEQATEGVEAPRAALAPVQRAGAEALAAAEEEEADAHKDSQALVVREGLKGLEGLGGLEELEGLGGLA